MKVIKTIPILVMLLLISLSSCKKENVATSCTTPSPVVINMDDLSICEFQGKPSVNLIENESVVIRSQVVFETLVPDATCYPNIAFTKYDLVIGKKKITSGLKNINYALTQNCETNQSKLKVLITKGTTTVTETVVYQALIPKLGGAQTVDIEITEDF